MPNPTGTANGKPKSPVSGKRYMTKEVDRREFNIMDKMYKFDQTITSDGTNGFKFRKRLSNSKPGSRADHI